MEEEIHLRNEEKNYYKLITWTQRRDEDIMVNDNFYRQVPIVFADIGCQAYSGISLF